MKIIKVNMREKIETPKTLLKYNFVPGKVVQFFGDCEKFHVNILANICNILYKYIIKITGYCILYFIDINTVFIKN